MNQQEVDYKIEALEEAQSHIELAMSLIKIAGEGWTVTHKLLHSLTQLAYAATSSIDELKEDIRNACETERERDYNEYDDKRFGLDKDI